MFLIPDESTTFPEEKDNVLAVVSFVLTANLILIYALLTQLMLLFKAKKPQFFVAGVLTVVMIFPLALAGIFRLSPENNPALWLLSPMPIIAVQYASVPTICLTILGQWTVATLLTLQLNKQLKKLGESQSKVLLSAN